MNQQFEEKVLACFLRLKEFTAITAPFLQPSLFTDTVFHNLYKIAHNFWTLYDAQLTEAGFSKAMSNLLERKVIDKTEVGAYVARYKRLLQADVSDHKFVMDELTNFVRHQRTKALIEKTVKEYLPKGRIDNFLADAEGIRAISGIGRVDDVSYWAEERIKQRFERREREKIECIRGITTGIKRLDDALHKSGWLKRELYAVLGDSKAGKTQFLLWCANAAAWAGYRVGYWTFETSTEVLEDRLDALNVNVPIRNVTSQNKAIIDKMMANRPTGNIHFFEYPTKTCTPANIRNDLHRMAVAGTPIQFGIFDYLDISKSERRYDSKWDEQVAVFEDTRAILGRPEKGGFDIPGLTGIQVGQKGSGKQIVSASDGAGAYEKIAVVDGALTISGTEEDRRNNELYINLSRFRNAPPITLKIKTDYERGRFYKEFVQTAI